MTSETVNATEELVLRLCRRSFLSLWSYANPRGKGGKELCDILVVCDPDVVIISVKAIGLGASGEPSVDWQRWRKRAIGASAAQIYGAERWLGTAPAVVRKDGAAGLPLPDRSVRRVHRVAVALGGQGKAPIVFGDFGRGFVHVFDETSLGIIMGELDTVSDFVAYLVAKEALYSSGVQTDFVGCEEDLFAFYLHKGRRFPENVDVLVVTDGIWEEFAEKDEYRAKKLADKDSYAWDGVIDEIGRTMARKDDVDRRFDGVDTRLDKIEARLTNVESDTSYLRSRATELNQKIDEHDERLDDHARRLKTLEAKAR